MKKNLDFLIFFSFYKWSVSYYIKFSTPQSKVTVDESIITTTNVKFIDITNGVGEESVDLLT